MSALFATNTMGTVLVPSCSRRDSRMFLICNGAFGGLGGKRRQRQPCGTAPHLNEAVPER